MNRSALVLIALTTVASAQPAKHVPVPIENRRTVGILDVRVDGVPDDIRAQFEKGLEQQLDTNHYWISTRSQMRERMKFSTKWTEGCFIGPCLAEIKVQTNADLVLLAALSGSGTSFGFSVTLVRTDTGNVLAQEASRCDVCTVNEAMNEAMLTTIKLINGVPDKLPDEAGMQRLAIERAVTPVRAEVATAAHRKKKLGVTLTVLGLATAGAGAAVYFAASKPAGAALAAGGGGLAFGGVCVLTF